MKNRKYNVYRSNNTDYGFDYESNYDRDEKDKDDDR